MTLWAVQKMLSLDAHIEYNQWTTENWEQGLLEDLKLLFNVSDEELRKCAEIVKDGIYEQIRDGRDYRGRKVTPKRSAGRIFVDTGFMSSFGVINVRASAKEYNVRMVEQREKAAYYLNTGTRFMPPRMFWGISEETMNKVKQYLINEKFKQLN